MLKLFYAPNACSLAPHIALNEAGADYEAVKVDTAHGEQRSPPIWRSTPRRGCRRWSPIAASSPKCRCCWASSPAIFPRPNWRRSTASTSSRCSPSTRYLASTIHITFAHIFRPERYAEQRRRQGRHAGQGAQEPDRAIPAGRGAAVRRPRLGAWRQIHASRTPIFMSSPAGSSATGSAASRPCPASPPTAPGCRRGRPCKTLEQEGLKPV